MSNINQMYVFAIRENWVGFCWGVGFFFFCVGLGGWGWGEENTRQLFHLLDQYVQCKTWRQRTSKDYMLNGVCWPYHSIIRTDILNLMSATSLSTRAADMAIKIGLGNFILLWTQSKDLRNQTLLLVGIRVFQDSDSWCLVVSIPNVSLFVLINRS